LYTILLILERFGNEGILGFEADDFLETMLESFLNYPFAARP